MDRDKSGLGNKEKALVALAAAMGAGCRHCADKLYPMALEAGASGEEIHQTLREGLAVREVATAIMKRKAETLLGHRVSGGEPENSGEALSLTRLTRLAAAVAANAAPDAVRHLEGAAITGASEGDIGVVLAIARKVRGKAQRFSDEEVDLHREESRQAASATNAEATRETDAPGEEACCGGQPESASQTCCPD